MFPYPPRCAARLAASTRSAMASLSNPSSYNCRFIVSSITSNASPSSLKFRSAAALSSSLELACLSGCHSMHRCLYACFTSGTDATREMPRMA